MHCFSIWYIVVSFQIQNRNINVQTYKEPFVLEKKRQYPGSLDGVPRHSLIFQTLDALAWRITLWWHPFDVLCHSLFFQALDAGAWRTTLWMLTLLGVRAYIKYIRDKVIDLVYARTPGNLSATTSVHIKHCGLKIFGVRAVLSGRHLDENAAIAFGMHRF